MNNYFIPTYKTLKRGDYRVTSFIANKTWRMDSSNYTSGSNRVQVFPVNFPLARNYKNNLIPISSSKYTPVYTPDGTYERTVLWNSLNHLYYKSFYDRDAIDYNKWVYRNNDIDRKLYESGSIISISQQNFGERLHPNSITVTDHTLGSGSLTSVYSDDGKFNLIDQSYDSGSYISQDGLMAYWGFDEKFPDSYEVAINNNKVLSFNTKLLSHENNVNGTLYGNPYFEVGVPSTGTNTSSIGLALTCDGATYMRVKNSPAWDMSASSSFGIGMFVNTPATQLNTGSNFLTTILGKSREGIVDGFNSITKKSERVEKDLNTSVYPFKFEIFNGGANEGKVKFTRSDGGDTAELISTSTINDGTYHHIFVTAIADEYKLYVDGVQEDSATQLLPNPINNKSDIFLGSEGVDRLQFSGSIDEVRVYKGEDITAAQVFDLQSRDYYSGSMLQTSRIGNVFYDEGIITVSDPRPKYKNCFMGETGTMDYSGSAYGWELTFKGEQTIYEHSILCKIRPRDFNMTLNPSARVGNTVTSEILKDFVSNDDFNPMISTIGLYNDNYELVAVGKLASPIPKREDVPLNLIVRFDT